MSLRIEPRQFPNGVDGMFTIYAYDSGRFDGQGLLGVGTFDVPVEGNTGDRYVHVIGYVSWSRTKRAWEVEAYHVFRPMLAIDALNLAAIGQYSSMERVGFDFQDDILLYTSNLQDALDRAQRALAELGS